MRLTNYIGYYKLLELWEKYFREANYNLFAEDTDRIIVNFYGPSDNIIFRTEILDNGNVIIYENRFGELVETAVLPRVFEGDKKEFFKRLAKDKQKFINLYGKKL